MICIVCASFTLKAQQGTERYSFCPSAPIAKDHEGNVYRTVQIGSQCWMAENMRCTTSPTGQRWYSNPYFSASQPEYAAYYATPLDARHGILYNWAAAMDLPAHQSHGKAVSGPVRGICPEGWYLPTPEKYEELNLHGAEALKSPLYWTDGGGDNSTGFTWLPAGWWNGALQRFEGLMSEGYFLAVETTVEGVRTVVYYMQHDCDEVKRIETHSGFGYSVRCVKEKD